MGAARNGPHGRHLGPRSDSDKHPGLADGGPGARPPGSAGPGPTGRRRDRPGRAGAFVAWSLTAWTTQSGGPGAIKQAGREDPWQAYSLTQAGTWPHRAARSTIPGPDAPGARPRPRAAPAGPAGPPLCIPAARPRPGRASHHGPGQPLRGSLRLFLIVPINRRSSLRAHFAGHRAAWQSAILEPKNGRVSRALRQAAGGRR